MLNVFQFRDVKYRVQLKWELCQRPLTSFKYLSYFLQAYSWSFIRLVEKR